MGRRRSVKTDRILSRDIETLKKNNNYATVEELVDHLRSTYPRYARHKLMPFTKCVYQIANTIGKEEVLEVDSDYSDDNAPTKKKRRKVDTGKEQLRAVDSSMPSTASSGNFSEEDESSDKEASTLDDAVYGKKFKPEFDLMTSMLRENYGRKSKKLSGAREVDQEALELEVVGNKDSRKVNLVNEGGKEGGVGGNAPVEFRRNDNNCDGDGNGNIRPIMFKDLGGMGGVIEKLMNEVIEPLRIPQVLRHIGLEPPVSGILLHGPPGCGKTKLAHAVANETGLTFYKISSTELVSGVSGASEENIRELFSKAYRTAPSVVFIDEIDAIASKRENSQREMDRRIVTQLMTCMDESYKTGYVLVIGATNRPDALDPALRRPGRFDREILLGVPDENARVEILSVLISPLKVESGFDILKIARSTPGFVGADLNALKKKAGNLAIKRIIEKRKVALSNKQVEDPEAWWRLPWSDEEMESISITMADFEEAAKFVQPSTLREGFSTIPDVKWDDIGGLHQLKGEFYFDIVQSIKRREEFEKAGVDYEQGFLLWGPPGCGKTSIAKAIANAAGVNFIHIKGPEIMNKYVGESEANVREMFNRARTCSPCIIFIDEVDALTTERGKEGGWVVERVLAQLMLELDGGDQRRGVFVIGATNRPDVMDPAILRPEKLGNFKYVPLPTPDERGMILQSLARNKPIDATVDLMAIAKDNACENFSGADLRSLMNKACAAALKEKFALSGTSSSSKPHTVKDVHFKEAFKKVFPSVSDKEIQRYELLSKRFKG